VNHFRCESHDRVTTLRRDRASAKPPRSRTPLVGYGVSRRSAVSRPTVHKHLHTGHAHEPLLELLVEWYVVSAHDDEQLGIRKRLRRERFEDLFLVARADAVCRRRIFQWFALSQVEAGLPSRWHQAHKTCILTMQRCQLHATVRLAPGDNGVTNHHLCARRCARRLKPHSNADAAGTYARRLTQAARTCSCGPLATLLQMRRRAIALYPCNVSSQASQWRPEAPYRPAV
jgi:hypothetical protein